MNIACFLLYPESRFLKKRHDSRRELFVKRKRPVGREEEGQERVMGGRI
jgi:hypothetical protein